VSAFEKCHTCKPPERKPGCQSWCPHYEKGKREYEAEKDRLYEQRRADNTYNSYHMKAVKRMKIAKGVSRGAK
jgi:hypothetical protein